MTAGKRLDLEREYHESEDAARGDSALIRGVYASGVFEAAQSYHLEALGDIRGLRVLDFGCGGGYGTARVSERGARVTAFDISETRLAEAQGHLWQRTKGPCVDLLLCSGDGLPFADGAFDAVYGKQVLHHVDLDTAVPEIVRVLRPGGRAVFLEPLIHNPLLEGYRRLTPHLRSPTEKALSMADLQRIGSHFQKWEHKEFCLLSVLPALVGALSRHTPWLTRLRLWLERVDRRLIGRWPAIGRYCWETVIVLER